MFFQIQSVFGHLMESKLQYFAPEEFWKYFKLWGQPVNVREQQVENYKSTQMEQVSQRVDDVIHQMNHYLAARIVCLFMDGARFIVWIMFFTLRKTCPWRFVRNIVYSTSHPAWRNFVPSD